MPYNVMSVCKLPLPVAFQASNSKHSALMR